MVKPKRLTAREKVERNAEKQVQPRRKDDDLATIISTAKSTPWDVRSTVFKNMEVGSAIIKDRLDNFDDLDAKTVITSKSFRGLNVRKKDKRKIKHHLFRQKVGMIQEAKEAMKAKKKRQKTVITGDMKPMVDSLPTLLPSVEQYIADNRKPKRNESESEKSKLAPNHKQRKKQQLSDINIFQEVLKHPQYKKNPSNTIQEHLENRLALENQTMDTA